LSRLVPFKRLIRSLSPTSGFGILETTALPMEHLPSTPRVADGRRGRWTALRARLERGPTERPSNHTTSTLGASRSTVTARGQPVTRAYLIPTTTRERAFTRRSDTSPVPHLTSTTMTFRPPLLTPRRMQILQGR